MIVERAVYVAVCNECEGEFSMTDINENPVVMHFESAAQANYYLPEYAWWIDAKAGVHLHPRCWAARDDS